MNADVGQSALQHTPELPRRTATVRQREVISFLTIQTSYTLTNAQKIDKLSQASKKLSERTFPNTLTFLLLRAERPLEATTEPLRAIWGL